MTAYVPLHVHSQYSYLDGASKVSDLIRAAADMDCPAIAITDHDNVSVAVDLYNHARHQGLAPIQGAELTMAGTDDNTYHLTVLAAGPDGYRELCRLLTRSHLDRPRAKPRLDRSVLAGNKHLIALSGCRRGEIPGLLLQGDYVQAEAVARDYMNMFSRERLFLEVPVDLTPGNRRLITGLAELGARLQLELVATGNVHYVHQDQFPAHDLLTCIRTGTRVGDVHRERRLNAENFLKSPELMLTALLRSGLDRAGAERSLAMTIEIGRRCSPAIVPGRCRYPSYETEQPAAMLRRLTYEGAWRRYRQVENDLAARIEHELAIIDSLNYNGYFLLVWDVGRFARSAGIRFAGRGSAADSVVAYCLGLTEVDAFGRDLLFERFLSRERAQKPDIDLDFDARRRDEVSDYVRRKYGEERVAGVCTYNTFRARSAIRDVGKALDLPANDIDRIARRLPHLRASNIEAALTKFPELRSSGVPVQLYGDLLSVCRQIDSFPRHIGTHVGGLVICDQPLTDISPLQLSGKGTTICQFDKVFVEELGLLKLDLLSLRTLTAVEQAMKTASARVGSFDQIPLTDPATMRMINRGQTIGVFQLESPAQRSLQARLGASEFEDIVASVALIRPGPIKGNMVQPFIDRRQGKEEISYLHPALEPILSQTYGVVLYQEQVIEIAQAVAGFTAGDADRLRRVMSHARSKEEMEELGRLFVDKAVERGVDRETASEIFRSVEGYASYGFCEAHAAAFADTACKTAYLVRHRPADFFAALLSCQPMGFYPPRTLCVEARRRGVTVLPPDVNKSEFEFTVEDDKRGRPAIRVGLGQVRDIKHKGFSLVHRARTDRLFSSVADVRDRSGLGRDQLLNLVRAGAVDGLCPNRKWATLIMSGIDSEAVADFQLGERVLMEERVLGLSVSAHPLELLRGRLKRAGFTSSAGMDEVRPGGKVRVAGIPVRPHRPPTQSGRTVVFLSLEDEFGLCEVTVFEDVYQRWGAVLFDGTGQALAIEGKVDCRGQARTVVADNVRALIDVEL